MNQEITIRDISEPFIAQKLIYDKCSFILKNIIADNESAAYGAHTFELNDLKVCFRCAKITPTKTGQFVTLWKRIGKEPIMPFDASDPIDIVVISATSGTQYGQFVFPRSVLIKQGIFTDLKEGKRAIRVYPPWDSAENPQAKKTQKWQLDYFFDASEDKRLDVKRAKMLYTSI